MSRGPDAATRLARAIEESRPGVVVVTRHATPWASVTFCGARHTLDLMASDSPGIDGWIEGLPEFDFVLPGHLVADLKVNAVERRGGTMTIALEALTVET